MLKDVVSVEYLGGYRLRVRFEDGAEGTVDISTMVDFVGVFAPLREETFMAAARVDGDLGTIAWPNGAHVDPVVLYAAVTGEPIPEYVALTDRVASAES
jgi:hypothetical protein